MYIQTIQIVCACACVYVHVCMCMCVCVCVCVCVCIASKGSLSTRGIVPCANNYDLILNSLSGVDIGCSKCTHSSGSAAVIFRVLLVVAIVLFIIPFREITPTTLCNTHKSA